jgi:hypothetical protein
MKDDNYMTLIIEKYYLQCLNLINLGFKNLFNILFFLRKFGKISAEFFLNPEILNLSFELKYFSDAISNFAKT